MEVQETGLPGVVVIRPRVFGDERGFFLESYHYERYRKVGITTEFVQDNHSRSSRGVLRGLHCQRRHGQAKLVRVSRGEVFDVAVDVRRGSETFGAWYGTILSAENHRQMFIPPGFAHGFCVLSDVADFEYKCSEYYHPEDELGIIWNDPRIGIDWPVRSPILSDRDAGLPRLSEVPEGGLPDLANTA